jgi:diacylglycerol O-acyltransferase / wax synthase
MAAEDLSAADRSSLQAERGPVNMAVAAPLVFERGPGTTYDAVAERVAARLHLIPRYRQKLADPAFGMANPVWVDDEAFDLHWHLRHATLPAPGSAAQLADHVAREMSRRLDRTRPLWELHVIDGLEGDRVALLPKMHHALVDGLAAIGIGMVLLDPTPEPMPIEPPEGGWAPRTFDRRRHLARLATTPLLRTQKLLLESTVRALDTTPRQAAADVRKATELATELARQRPQAPMTPLNETISPNRRFAMRKLGLPAVKAAGKAAGGTVNDAILVAVTGMLARYLDVAGTDLDGRDPVALVPVSVRREDEQDAGGNRISTVFVDLPVHEPDVGERLRRVSAQMQQLRQSAAVRAGAMIAGATGAAPPLIAGVMVRAMGGVRAMNLVVSNLPGPQQAFYMNGSRLLEVYPAVPLNPPNQGLSVGVLSYDGCVFFGLLADARLDPGVDVAAEALDAALDEVVALAGLSG